MSLYIYGIDDLNGPQCWVELLDHHDGQHCHVKIQHDPNTYDSNDSRSTHYKVMKLKIMTWSKVAVLLFPGFEVLDAYGGYLRC